MTSLRIAPTELDCWSTEDDELTLQYPAVLRNFPRDRDTISMMSADSTDSSRGSHFSANHDSLFVAAGDIRRRLSESLKGRVSVQGVKLLGSHWPFCMFMPGV